jgi:transposase
MMLKVLFYSYLSNIYSCRKIAKALNEKRNAARIHFMWISGNSTPDFRTINNFRRQKLKHHIHDLFAEVVKMLQELQVLSLDIQHIDGTGTPSLKLSQPPINILLCGVVQWKRIRVN